MARCNCAALPWFCQQADAHLVSVQVRWMMYWIVFALYTVLETITDLTMAW